MFRKINIVVIVSLLLFAKGDTFSRKSGYGPGKQDWGWFDVRQGAHMFYWLFYSTANVTSVYDRPLILYLQGGPGLSGSALGNFFEVGPVYVNGTLREFAWTKSMNVLFIDSPVGAGYSYVDDASLVAKDNIQIGKDVVSFIKQFYDKFPNFQKSNLYLFGEGYGGKMAAEIAKQLDESIKVGKIKARFNGIVLNGAFVNPKEHLRSVPPFLLHTGLVDDLVYRNLTTHAAVIEKLMDKGEYKDAIYEFMLMNMNIFTTAYLGDAFNILNKLDLSYDSYAHKTFKGMKVNRGYWDEWEEIFSLMEGPVKKALAIPDNITFDSNYAEAFEALQMDILKPVDKVVEHLLNNTKLGILICNGNLNLMSTVYGATSWTDKLKWKGQNEWKTSQRLAFVMNGIVEGHGKNVEDLYFVWFNAAGHWISKDNPKALLHLIQLFTGVKNEGIDGTGLFSNQL